jgi:regulatory protein
VAERPSAFDKAVELLALRPHFRAQLAGKLRARGYSEEEAGGALDRLTELGYLDDRKVARDFVASRLRRGPVGRRRLVAELARRGVASAVIEEAIDEALAGTDESGTGRDADLAGAREAARRWAARSRSGGEDPRALARHLDRLGFSRHAILEVLNERGE